MKISCCKLQLPFQSKEGLATFVGLPELQVLSTSENRVPESPFLQGNRPPTSVALRYSRREVVSTHLNTFEQDYTQAWGMQCFKGCRWSWTWHTAAVPAAITPWAHSSEGDVLKPTGGAGWEMPSATSKVGSDGLRQGRELSNRQLSQQMWASTLRLEGRLEKSSLLLALLGLAGIFAAKRAQFAPSSLRLLPKPYLNNKQTSVSKKDQK